MGTFFVFFGILLLSQFVALLAGLQLADHFRATEEFIAVMMAIIVFAVIAMVAFAIAYALARTTRPLRTVATTLVVVVLVLLALPTVIPWLYEPKVNPLRITTKEVPVLLELLVPALILILVQWGLVRRRWLRVRADEDLSYWPWITTVLAGLIVLNPIGLELVSSALRAVVSGQPTPNRTIAIAGATIFAVMACIEVYVRGRMLHRRVTSYP
jgi:hypothetical protein